jgi:glycosyltransferase involved in cell wall biosynthesis
MSPHRVMFVEASVGGVLGGSLTGIVQLLERLDRRRFPAALALYEPKEGMEELGAAGIPVHVLPPLPAFTGDGRRGRLGRALVRAGDLYGVVAPRARALMQLFRRERPDLVYLANGLTANLDGVVAAARCRLPIVCHEKGYRRVGPVERFMSRWLDVSIGMTDDLVAHYRARAVRARRFVTIFDGIDTARFAPGGGAAVRREFGIPADAPLAGIVGHIQEWKGQLLVAEAVARARRAHPALRCLVVGGVHREGAAYAERLRARIAEPDLAGHVILTGARRDVPACLDAMDVAVHASTRAEPFGRVLIEAMALGTPVVAPREGGPLDIVQDGVSGLLVAPREPQGFADAIAALIGDGPRRAAMGRAARERVDRVFDIRHHVRAIEGVFEELLGARPLPAAASA